MRDMNEQESDQDQIESSHYLKMVLQLLAEIEHKISGGLYLLLSLQTLLLLLILWRVW